AARGAERIPVNSFPELAQRVSAPGSWTEYHSGMTRPWARCSPAQLGWRVNRRIREGIGNRDVGERGEQAADDKWRMTCVSHRREIFGDYDLHIPWTGRKDRVIIAPRLTAGLAAFIQTQAGSLQPSKIFPAGAFQLRD